MRTSLVQPKTWISSQLYSATEGIPMPVPMTESSRPW